MTARRKMLLAVSAGAVLSMGGYLIVDSMQSQRQAATARSEIRDLVEGTTVDTTAAILRLITAQDETLRKGVDSQLNVLRDQLRRQGKITFSKDRVRWTAVNQFTKVSHEELVPKMLFGGLWLGQNANSDVPTPIVDDAERLAGGTETIFQRVNEHGDMLRVATNVKKEDGHRAIGTFIPETNPDGKPNPVLAKVLKGETYRGVAWVVNAYYVADYEPLRDESGRIIGMHYAGERQEYGHALRNAIASATVGKTGSFMAIATTDNKRGTCLISRDARNGEDLLNATDLFGMKYGREILDTASSLKPGQTAIVHYTLGSRVKPIPILARVANYAPWGWAVVAEAHEDDFAPVYDRLRNNGHGAVVAFLLLCGAMVLIGLPLIWAEATERKSREMERASAAKSEFLSRMSHELRTPMNAILGFAQILQMDDLTDDQMESLIHIRKAGEHLLRLINEVLDISRIEAGRVSLSLESVSIHEIAREVELLVRPMAEQRNISLTVNLGENERAHVTADRQRLLQVLLNLASNGVKYNREGGSLELAAERIADNRIRISVADTGLGIPQDRTSQLFVPFERLGADQGEIEGTGLGLALSKRLVEVMGGKIGFRTSSSGTTFFVDFASVASPMSTFPESESILELPEIDEAGRQRTVLLIEDNLSNADLIEKVLEARSGIKLLVAMKGNLGYELAVKHQPDLILLDLNLPDCHGRDLLHRIKSTPGLGDVKVVVVSADATEAQISRLQAAGAFEYLTKPLNLKQFIAVLETALDLGDELAA
ncbi:MAG TPA: Cache 3/Cache 2 fusion domain-containing protein [Fimbriimonadaceae bacterium]|nr:Cache 3/Cache 2 fusion domain-containing protein [Fimbriimonadaceae bacterium]